MNTKTTSPRKRVLQTTIPLRNLASAHRVAVSQHVDDGPGSDGRSGHGLLTKPDLGHDFSRIQVHSDTKAVEPKRGSCPLPSASPRLCPFGGACHACPIRSQAKQSTGAAGNLNTSISTGG